jgi:hypothetical protein
MSHNASEVGVDQVSESLSAQHLPKLTLVKPANQGNDENEATQENQINVEENGPH